MLAARRNAAQDAPTARALRESARSPAPTSARSTVTVWESIVISRGYGRAILTVVGRRRSGLLALARAVELGPLAQQTLERGELFPSGIGNGAVFEVTDSPRDQVIPRARGRSCERAAAGGPGKHVDDMRTVPVHEHRRALSIDILGAAADEHIALRSKVGDRR